MRFPIIISLLTFILFSGPCNVQAQTEVQGEVQGVWNSEESPYVAIGDITIPDGDSLRIEAGVEVQFNDLFVFSISGNIHALGTERDSVYFKPVPGGEAWGGMRFTDADNISLFQYCVFTNGQNLRGEGNLDTASSGGNIFIQRSEVIFENTRISAGTARGMGGGIGIIQSSPIFRNCLVNGNNTVFAGGGVAVFNGSNPRFFNCSFVENNNNVLGGGVYINERSNPEFEDCHFLSNSTRGEGGDGGAAGILTNSNPVFRKCLFEENESFDSGGAIYIRGEGTSPLFEWCDFLRNTIVNGDMTGGAVYIRSLASPEIRYCRFIENVADLGGAIYFKEPPQSNVHHCLFNANGSRRGGAALATSTDFGEGILDIKNCTFINQHYTGIDPTALTANARNGSRIRFISCIIWDEEPRFSNDNLISMQFTHIRDGYEGEGNSAEYPDFYALDDGLFLLHGNSPCIDSGDPELPADSDESQNDRGWIHVPHNALEGIEVDTLRCNLTTIDRDSVALSFTNRSGVPIYVSPFDNWREGIREAMFDVTGLTGDIDINGITWTESGFYLAGGNSGGAPNKIYHLDREFNLRRQFDQPIDRGMQGFLDLASDGGDVLFGGNDVQIIEFTVEGEVGDPYDAPNDIEYIRSIGADFYNPVSDVDFYLSGDEGFIVQADGEMWERNRIDIGETVLGLGVKPNYRALYIVTQPEEGVNLLSIVLPDKGSVYPLYTLRLPDAHTLGGMEITQDWTEGRGTLMAICKGELDDSDFLMVEDLYTAWLVTIPDVQLVMPGESYEWKLIFAGDQVPAGRYVSSFYLSINGSGEDGEMPALMNLIQSSVGQHPQPLPQSVVLYPIYPNPFNSIGNYSFNLPVGGIIRVYLADNLGRTVEVYHAGYIPAGNFKGAINSNFLPSGSYFLRLDTQAASCSTPVVILR